MDRARALQLLRGGSEPVRRWNRWRVSHPNTFDLAHCDLSGVDLSGANLSHVDLHASNLSRAKLIDANLERTDLHRSNLKSADLTVPLCDPQTSAPQVWSAPAFSARI